MAPAVRQRLLLIVTATFVWLLLWLFHTALKKQVRAPFSS